MNRQERRQRLMDRWYDSRLGWIGWASDIVAWAGCRYAGHQPFSDDPGCCRWCGIKIEQVSRAHARWRRIAWWSRGASEALLPFAYLLLGALLYAMVSAPDTVPPVWLLTATGVVFAVGVAALVVSLHARGKTRRPVRRQR